MLAYARRWGTTADGAVVRQAVDVGLEGRFRKEVLTARVATGHVALVRKRPAEGPARRGVVLLVHGYAQNRYSWHVPQRSFANYLAVDGFDVFNLDLRGVGRSRALGTPPAEGFSDYVAEDLPRAAEAALRASGARRLFVVGHSLGGAAACAFAGRHPELVRGVVTVSGVYGFGRRNRALRLAGRVARVLEPLAALPRTLPTDHVGRTLWWSRAAFDSPLAGALPLQAWAPGSMERDVLREAVLRSFEPGARGVSLDLARLARGEELRDPAGRRWFDEFETRRELPLLVVASPGDRLVSPEDAREAYRRSPSRDKRFVRLAPPERGAGWGHMDILLGRDARERVWPTLRDWLRAH